MKGLIQYYFGDGKGKTTAAAGSALRALGRGLAVLWIQYCKDITKNPSGEIIALKKAGADFLEIAPKIPLFNKNIDLKDIINDCTKSIDTIYNIFNENKYSLLILDEINAAVTNGYISEEKLLQILKKKPSNLEIILTGRGMHQDIINHADLVSEMKLHKHPFNKGIHARKGIEY
ncbi:MAG: cob(I)yrinic acid a,c-diamide adenosyltransferase [bacterium]